MRTIPEYLTQVDKWRKSGMHGKPPFPPKSACQKCNNDPGRLSHYPKRQYDRCTRFHLYGDCQQFREA